MNKQTNQLPFRMITFLHFLPFLLSTHIINAATYNPTEHILLNCGSSSKLNSSDGQSWDGDVGTKLSPDINQANLSFPATATEQDPSISSQVPYMTARIIRSQFSYTLPVSPGQKILLLYFYPATYSGDLYKNQSFFGVTANHYTLLSNFSAFLAVSDLRSATLVKEFIINVQQTQVLNITFLPSANSYAFVNGIEVVSIPDNLYMGSHDINSNPLRLVTTQNSFYQFGQNDTAFETLYRLNVGGPAVAAVSDTGMFREWSQDDGFILGSDQGNALSNSTISLKYTLQTPNYSAPPIVYTTARAMGLNSPLFNLTWIFPVDSGFYYLLRLHFCEFMPFLINGTGQRVFTIFINNSTAEQEADVIRWSGGTGIPIFRDYVVFVSNPSHGSPRKEVLFLALHPCVDIKPVYNDAILNGLEIFKLNSTGGNLAGSNPELEEDPGSLLPNSKPQDGKKGRGRIGMVFAVVGGVAGGGALILILSLYISRRRRGMKDFDRQSASKSSWAPLSTPSRSTKTTASGGSSSLPLDLCRRFLLEEIKSATANFDATFVIGTGGFGNVYRGYIDNNLTTVAIKRLNPSSSQGAHEFRTEIEMLSNLRHFHLVSLIGYCDEKGEMILVYDYMANGTLRGHLYRTENPPLAWKQRLQICIGAAKGLHYLHTGAKHNIIHRDVKSTNILLDEKWVAKVSDFGLSKLGPSGGIHSHVSTQVKGSFGYVDPEYYKRQQLTDKSDVYSFGVVLFEVLCARPAVLPTLPREQVNLAEWARRCCRKGTIAQIVDPNLKGQIAPECLRSYTEIAFNCLKDQGAERPTMSDIVWSLEFALQLQEAADKEGDHRPILFPLILHGRGGGEDAGTTSTGDDDTTSFLTSGEVNIAAADLLKGQSGTTTDGLSTSGNSSTTDKLKSDTVFSEIMNPTAR